MRSMRSRVAALAAIGLFAISALAGTPALAAPTLARISGAGSTWSQNALDQWRANVKQFGITVDYQGSGSSDGRNQFKNGTVDFAVSEIPYGINDQGTGIADPPPPRGFTYMPIVAGGTAFMYNLKVGSKRITNLRLSGEVITKIFTRQIQVWNDPAIAADNPGLTLPARRIVPVVRSDGSGTTAQFTLWMSSQYPALWNQWCAANKRNSPCGLTSYFPYPSDGSVVGQSGSLGVSGYVAQNQGEGAITYVEYSYARKTGFPVAKVLNSSGFYVEPKATSVAVGMLDAQINPDLTQRLDGVYQSKRKAAYPLSSYSYMILPTKLENGVTTAKGYTLGVFSYYMLCQGQQSADNLGYSPLPINLVKAGFDQIRKIPGVVTQDINIAKCNNPTFSTDGSNTLAKNTPDPPDCDRKGGPVQCSTGTGGASQQTTPTKGGGTPAQGGVPAGGKQPVTPGGVNPSAGAAGNPTTPAGGVAPSGAAVDQETGEVVGGGGAAGGAAYVDGVPVALAADGGWDMRHTVMLLAALVLAALVVGPPLLARIMRTDRRGDDR